MRCAAHPDTETRLQCSQCEKPICPKCMVTCPVGFKCRTCVNKTESHVLRVTPAQFATAAVLGVMAGVACGWAVATFGCGWSWMTLLLAYVGGLFVGKAIHGLTGRKLSRALALVTLASLLGGILLHGCYTAMIFAVPGVYWYSLEASAPLWGPLLLHDALMLGGCWHGFFQGVRFR